MENIEILVHISAPSGAKDDKLYRRRAAAFLEYEKGKQIAIASNSISDDLERHESGIDEGIQEGENDRIQDRGRSEGGQNAEPGFRRNRESKDLTPQITSSTTSDGHDYSSRLNSASPFPAPSKTRSTHTIAKDTAIKSSSKSYRQSSLVLQEDAAVSSRKRKHSSVDVGPKNPLRTPGGPSDGLVHSRSGNQPQTTSSGTSRVLETPLHPVSISSGTLPSLKISRLNQIHLEQQRPRTAPSATIRREPSHQKPTHRRSRSATDSFESPLSTIPDSQPLSQPLPAGLRKAAHQRILLDQGWLCLR